MNRWLILAVSVMVLTPYAMGCTDGSDPLIPTGDPVPQVVLNSPGPGMESQTHLWGLWEVSIDPDDWSVDAVPCRDAMFTANVVQFLNGNPANLAFQIQKTFVGSNYT